MNYNIHFIYTAMMYAPVEVDIPIELTDEEVTLIRQSVSAKSKQSVDEQLRHRQKKIYKKIITAGYPMCQATSCRNIRLEDMGNDIAWEQADYDALLQEDIQKGFDPNDENGHPYGKEELLRAWVKWEDQQLSPLSYAERVNFYANRYHFAVDGLLEKHLGSLHFTLPSAIDITGPTDSWLKRKIRHWL